MIPAAAIAEPVSGGPKQVGIRIYAENSDGLRDLLQERKGPAGVEMSLVFQPLLDGVARIGTPPDPDSMPVWAPVFIAGSDVVSGRAFAPLTGALPASENGKAPFAPDGDIELRKKTKMELVNISTDAAPSIEVVLDVGAGDFENWAASQFQVTDGGERVAIQVALLPDSGKNALPLLLVLDMSASMAPGERVFAANRMAQAIVAALPENCSIGIVAATADARIVRAVAPINAGDITEEVDSAFILGGGLDLGAAIAQMRQGIEGAVDIILIGDGAIDGLETREGDRFFGI